MWKRLGEGKDNQSGMLKEEKVVFFIISALPLLWLLNLLMLAIGAYELGEIPRYGNIRDPSSLDLWVVEALGVVNIFLPMICMPDIVLYPILIISSIVRKDRKLEKVEFVGFGLFVTGVIGLLLFGYVFSSQFEWILD